MDEDNAPNIEEQYLRATDGLSLYSCWHWVDQPIGVVILTHGLGEHSSRYGHVIHRFQMAGLAVLRFDLRGHGRSDGKPGYVSSYNQLMDDISLVVEQARTRFPDLPLVLFGHSLGGNLIANWGIRRRQEAKNVAGAIISASWLKLVDVPNAWGVALVRLFARIAPRLIIPANLRPGKLSRNPTAINQYIHDPMIHKFITTRMAVEVYDAAAWALEHAGEFELPLLGIHGTADPVTSPAGTELFCHRAPHGELLLFEGLIHEPHNEPEWPTVVGAIRNWIVQQIERVSSDVDRTCVSRLQSQ